MSSRIGLRFLNQTRWVRGTFRQPLGRRYQATDATAVPSQSLGSRLWNSPVGVKTVHFWAPVMKWALVLTGVSDFYRPAEKLSLTQNLALMATGAIWTRWCFIIKPKNILLAAVNFFLGIVGAVQVSRILLWQRSIKNDTVGNVVAEDVKDIAASGESVVKEAGSKAKQALN